MHDQQFRDEAMNNQFGKNANEPEQVKFNQITFNVYKFESEQMQPLTCRHTFRYRVI